MTDISFRGRGGGGEGEEEEEKKRYIREKRERCDKGKKGIEERKLL